MVQQHFRNVQSCCGYPAADASRKMFKKVSTKGYPT
ncbi:MAG: hypothetical protein JWR83_1374 [Aeromicrobium sp.]|nr:hypothetical protein [Aeromicrobium sp.]